MIVNFTAKNILQWPEVWKNCFDSWQDKGISIKMWSDEQLNDLINEVDPFPLLEELPTICKIDYFRYCLLEKHGGIYADMDIELISNFIPQISKDKIYLMGADWHDEIYQNSLMISPPDPIWKGLRDLCKHRMTKYKDSIPDLYSMGDVPGTMIRYVVGPIALSDYFKDKNVTTLPKRLFNRNGEFMFTKHHQTAHWGDLIND